MAQPNKVIDAVMRMGVGGCKHVVDGHKCGSVWRSVKMRKTANGWKRIPGSVRCYMCGAVQSGRAQQLELALRPEEKPTATRGAA